MPRGKTRVGRLAERRPFEMVREELIGIRPNGDEMIKTTYSVPCVECGYPFETLGGGYRWALNNPKEFAYKLNWRCVECRGPNNEAKMRARLVQQVIQHRAFARSNEQRRLRACLDLV